jgi:hypothetical protein
MPFKYLAPVTIVSCMAAILGTGLLLNIMAGGSLGTQAASLATKITKGYGV